MKLSVVEEINRWCGQRFDCTCGKRHEIPTRLVLIDRHALDKLPEALKQVGEDLGEGGTVIVSDETTYSIAAVKVEHILRRDASYRVEPVVLPSPCVPDLETLAQIEDRVEVYGMPGGLLVAVGSGTINDLVKLAAYRAKRPYVVCTTAPSMNGYPSSVAAILAEGVKRTWPAMPPLAIIADLDILAAAPLPMICSGLADLLSRGFANSDWRLSSLLFDEYYCSQPLMMLDRPWNLCRDMASQIGNASSEGIEVLTGALILSGFSMVIAGSSSPASGGEHLISHYWDMTHHIEGKETFLHGLQVGIASLISATLYEKLLALSPNDIALEKLERNYPTWEQERKRIYKEHGELANEVEQEYQKKYLHWKQKREQIESLCSRWTEVWSEIQPMLLTPGELRETLKEVGAPTTASELGLTVEEVRNALLRARYIRGRYTVLDLAADLGILEPMADEILHDSGVSLSVHG